MFDLAYISGLSVTLCPESEILLRSGVNNTEKISDIELVERTDQAASPSVGEVIGMRPGLSSSCW